MSRIPLSCHVFLFKRDGVMFLCHVFLFKRDGVTFSCHVFLFKNNGVTSRVTYSFLRETESHSRVTYSSSRITESRSRVTYSSLRKTESRSPTKTCSCVTLSRVTFLCQALSCHAFWRVCSRACWFVRLLRSMSDSDRMQTSFNKTMQGTLSFY